ncbi:MAG: metallophosphoesterase family protein [Deltaproteobacteria bacterium]
MIITYIVDIHGNAEPINELGEVLSNSDLVIIGGDLTQFGGEKDAEEIIELIKTYNGEILAVTGNCDTKEIDDYLFARNMNLHGQSVKLDGLSVIGAGGSLPCPTKTPNEYSEEELTDILEKSVWDSDTGVPVILVSHQPPLNTSSDKLSSGVHVGSSSVREFIEKIQPLVCFTGHIHEAPGIDEIGATKIVNPGPLGTRSYAYLDVTDKINTLEIRKF